MSAFITYSEIDTDIQKRMANAVPNSGTRLVAINNAIQDLYAEYDIESGKRDVVLYVVADGQPIDLSSYAADFKRPSDLRYLSPDQHTEEFAYIHDDLFAVHIGRDAKINEYTTNYNNGKLYLKVSTENGNKSVKIHDMGDLTSNGTWASDTTSSDATATELNGVVTLNQGNNIEWNADVSQSVNNYTLIENSTMEAKDLSDYESLGRFRHWVYIPEATDFTSVELRWGSSSSAYWSRAVTTQGDGTAFVDGWNFIEVDWNGATETGTVDEENIDYLALKMNYAAGYTDQNNFRAESITCYLPEPMKFSYYTYYGSQDSTGSFQEDMTETSTDELLIPRRYKTLISLMSQEYLVPIALGPNDSAIVLNSVRAAIKKAKEALQRDIGNTAKTPGRKFKIRRPY